MAAGNPNYDALLSSTLANYRDKFEDNVSTHVALWWWLKEAGRVEKKGGGESIVIQLMYGKNTTSGTFSGYDSLALTPQAGLTSARFEWKRHNVTVALSGEEADKNNGPQEIIDLWKAKVMQAEITAAEDFNDMFASKAAPGNSGKNLNGIGVLVGDASSTVTTVGGIDASDADNAWWRSYVERTAGALTLADIGTAYRAASRGPDKPDVAFTTDALHASFESQLQPQQRFTNPKAAEVGFENLLYKGATVMTDADAATGDFTFLNTKYVKLIQHSNRWLTPTAKDSTPGVDAYYQHIISMGNLVTSNRKLAGARLEGRTA